MELNQEALRTAINAANCYYGTDKQLEGAIKAYLESVEAQRQPKPIPFDPALVKPGDEVICEGLQPKLYIGLNRHGQVITENYGGGLNAWPVNHVTIPPKPKKVVKVLKVYEHNDTYFTTPGDGSPGSHWKLLGKIEVTE